MMNTRYTLLYILSALLLTGALAGCRDAFSDRTEVPTPEPGRSETIRPDGTVEVRIPYLAPAMEQLTTRALTPQEECTIDASMSRLFVFDQSGAFLYEAPISSVRPEGTEQGKYDRGTVTAFLKEGTEVRLALYANLSKEQMKTEVSGSIDEVARKFTFAMPVGTSLPMYGTLSGVTVSHTLSSGTADAVQTVSGTIRMLRSVARVDVGFNLSGTAMEEKAGELTGRVFDASQGKYIDATYTIKKVYLYSASSSGQVAPNSSALASDQSKVTALSLPENVAKMAEPQSYDPTNGALIREIYLPETDNKPYTGEQSGAETKPESDKVHLARPYLIVEMTNDKETRSHFFRIDFLKYSAEVTDPKTSIEEQTDARVRYTYLPILRNYRYKVNITKIGGPGFDSLADAQKGSAADIQYNVLALSEHELGDVMYDGKYMLSVTESEFSIGMYGSQPTYKAFTTWPDGWKIEVPEYIPGTKTANSLYSASATDHSSWITFATTSGKANVTSQVIQTVTTNETGSPRVGYFYVRAGRMRWLITVRQSATADLAISLWSDPEAKNPLQYLEIHQQGLLATPTPTQKRADYPLEEAHAYRRFFIKTDPYVDPNNTAVFRDFFVPKGKSTGRDSEFYFYDFGKLKYEGSRIGEDVLKRQWESAGHGKWHKLSETGDHKFFSYTGHDNLWECYITAPPVSKSDDPFEFYSGRFTFAISDGTHEASTQLTVQQIEYGADPGDRTYPADRYATSYVVDGSVRYKGDKKPYFPLNGEEYSFSITANTPYRIILTSDDGQAIKQFGNGARNEGGVSYSVYEDYSPTMKGRRITFTTNKDAKLKTSGEALYATFRVESPEGKFLPYIFRIYFVPGIIQPEANCYMIKAGVTDGIFIPVSRVNTAADYYDTLLEHDRRLREFPHGKSLELLRVDEGDTFEPFLIWTDMGDPKGEGSHAGERVENGQYDLNWAGIAHLDRLGSGEGAYVYVALNKQAKPGSALIGIRSTKIPGKPVLWSWHLWVVSEYPKPLRTSIDRCDAQTPWRNQFPVGGQESYPKSLDTMDRLLGANRAVKEMPMNHYREPETYGYCYQFGRKDPFPSWKLIIPMKTWPGNHVDNEQREPKKYYDERGRRFYFEYHVKGDITEKGMKDSSAAAGATMSMREAIASPETIVSHASMWLYESTPYMSDISGGSLPSRYTFLYLWNRVGNSSQRERQAYVGKTVFDPSPYGWRIPCLQEAAHQFMAYQKGLLWTPRPGFVYDGDYTCVNTEIAMVTPPGYVEGFNYAFVSYIAEGNPSQHAGMYIRHSGGTADVRPINGGWRNEVQGSFGASGLRRACALSIRPVLNSEEPSYTKYLPGYEKTN